MSWSSLAECTCPPLKSISRTWNKTIQDQEEQITDLKMSSQSRLYTGLIQGAIIGLVTGGAAAWVVSRRIRIVEDG